MWNGMCTIEMIENLKIEKLDQNVGVCHFARIHERRYVSMYGTVQ